MADDSQEVFGLSKKCVKKRTSTSTLSSEIDTDGVGALLGGAARAMRQHRDDKLGIQRDESGKVIREDKSKSAVEQKGDRFQTLLVSATLTQGVQKLGRFWSLLNM